MLNKYEVGTEEDGALGIYYAESEEEAIAECKQDHLYYDGKKITHRVAGVSARNMMYNLIARNVG